MKVLGMDEAEVVSGGMCENMSFNECFDGFSDRIAEEVESAAGHMSDWWDAWCDYNNVGYWIYDVTHC